MNSAQFFAQIKRGFASLSHFAGRDRRGQFWPYALAVFVITQSIAIGVGAPMLVAQIFAGLERAEQMARDNPQDWIVERSPGNVHYQYVGDDPAVLGAMMPDLSAFLWVVVALSVVSILLLAAAVVRRLHDRGFSGLWGLVPTGLLLAGLWLSWSVFAIGMADGGGAAMLTPILLLFAVNLAYLVSLLLIIIQLASAGSPDANRFGPPPVA